MKWKDQKKFVLEITIAVKEIEYTSFKVNSEVISSIGIGIYHGQCKGTMSVQGDDRVFKFILDSDDVEPIVQVTKANTIRVLSLFDSPKLSESELITYMRETFGVDIFIDNK